MDKNDSPPIFTTEDITFETSEDLHPNSVIGFINATDPDTIGSLTFALESYEKVFELDKNSGMLKLIDTLDREKQDLYKLSIRASDGVQSTVTTVSIRVNYKLHISQLIRKQLTEFKSNQKLGCRH